MKELIIQQIKQILQERIDAAALAMKNAQAAANEETKSSVGDKYETGRAMNQLNLEMYGRQHEQAASELAIVEKIDVSQIPVAIGIGSLAKTSMGIFFVAVGTGKVSVGKELIMAISPQSPIGELLMHKKQGDSFDFRGKKVEVLEVS
ncbi:MAG: transcription elongation factor [Spirosomataceae bacterium]